MLSCEMVIYLRLSYEFRYAYSFRKKLRVSYVGGIKSWWGFRYIGEGALFEIDLYFCVYIEILGDFYLCGEFIYYMCVVF